MTKKIDVITIGHSSVDLYGGQIGGRQENKRLFFDAAHPSKWQFPASPWPADSTAWFRGLKLPNIGNIQTVLLHLVFVESCLG